MTRALLRDRAYRRLLIGQTLSAFGDHAMFLALAVWVKALTGSNAKAGLAILPFVLPSLFGPALGVYVDRFSRRRVMIGTDLAAALSLLPLLGVHDAGDIWLTTSSFLLGLATVVYDAARAGLLVSLIPGDELGDANGLLQSTNQAMRLLAPLAGAALFAIFGGEAVAGLDAITFVVSALFLLGVAAPTIERAEENDFWAELRAGLRDIVPTTDVRRTRTRSATLFVTLAAGVMEVVMIFALIDAGLHKPSYLLGVLSTAQGVGAGGGRRHRRHRDPPARRAPDDRVGADRGGHRRRTARDRRALAGARVRGVRRDRSVVLQRRVRHARAAPDRRGDAGPRDGRDRRRVHPSPSRSRSAFGALIVGFVSFRTVYLVEAAAFVVIALYLAATVRGDYVTRPPSTGRRRRLARARSSLRGARAPLRRLDVRGSPPQALIAGACSARPYEKETTGSRPSG